MRYSAPQNSFTFFEISKIIIYDFTPLFTHFDYVDIYICKA